MQRGSESETITYVVEEQSHDDPSVPDDIGWGEIFALAFPELAEKVLGATF
jgi:hypothetical protein